MQKKLRLSSMSFNCTNDHGMWGYLGTCIMANREMEKRSFALSLTFANIRISGPRPIQSTNPVSATTAEIGGSAAPDSCRYPRYHPTLDDRDYPCRIYPPWWLLPAQLFV